MSDLDNIIKEKNRLLKSINVVKMHGIKTKIQIENIGLRIDKYINYKGYNLVFFSDIKMNPAEINKYDKETSKITINLTLYNKKKNIIDNGEVTIYFDGGLFSTEFKGSKTVEYEFRDLNLSNVNEIKIQIDADLTKLKDKNLEDTQIDIKNPVESNDSNEEERIRILKCIERMPEIEKKYGITIENVGLKIDGNRMTFYLDVSITSTNWSYIEFKCVLYDKNNSIIGSTFANVTSDGFIGFDTLSSLPTSYQNNIHKVRIYPSKVRND